MNSQQSVSEANRTRARSFPVLNAMTGRLQCRKLGFNRFSTGQCPEPEIWCQLLGPHGIGVVCIEAHFYANLARNQRSTTIERSSRNGSNIQYLNSLMAEREGFEPPIAFRLCLISSQVHSTGLCHLSACCRLAPVITSLLAKVWRLQCQMQSSRAAGPRENVRISPGQVHLVEFL